MESEEVKNQIKGTLDQIKKETFVDGYKATDEEAMGMLLSKYFEWNGNRILKACAYGLEDANFHQESAIVMDLIK